MDFLYRDNITRAFYGSITYLIQDKIAADEVDLIRENHIILAQSISPGTALSNFNLPPSQNPLRHHLIIIDKVILDHCNFDIEERAATILHEIGHILNEPDDTMQKEFYADYYAKQLGFARPLASSLSKYINADLPYITTEIQNEIKERIKRLQETKQTPLRGHIKQLR